MLVVRLQKKFILHADNHVYHIYINSAFLAVQLLNCCCHLETLLNLKYL